MKIRTLGLVAVAAMAAMGLFGASSASATLSTLLCKTHTEPCNSLPTVVHFKGGPMVLVVNPATVLCLSSLLLSTPLGLGTAPAPQQLHNTELLWFNCGTNAAHNDCTVTTTALGIVEMLRTALNVGTGNVLNNRVSIACGEIINCVYGSAESIYSFEGALHTAGAGHGLLIGKELVLSKVSGGFLCAASAKMTTTFEVLEHLFLVG